MLEARSLRQAESPLIQRTGAALRAALGVAFGAALRAVLGVALGAALGAVLGAVLGAALGAALGAEVKAVWQLRASATVRPQDRSCREHEYGMW